MAQFRRKPHRKSILRQDAVRVGGEVIEQQGVVRSTQLKKDPIKHRQKADAIGRIVGIASAVWLVEEESVYAGVHTEPLTLTHECITGGVMTTDNPEDESLLAVGDWVDFARLPDDPSRGVIIHVHKRSTRLFRYSPVEHRVHVIAANVERAVFVHAVTQPRFSRRLLDRHLVAAELGDVEPVIVFNKIDLGILPEVENAMSFYRDQLGIRMCLTSTITGEGIESLRLLMRSATSVFVGASGVGKSALVNTCFGINLQAVRSISKKYQRGRHTTTNARLFHLPGSGQLIDTPGLREFALARIEAEQLALYFHDFDPYYPHCKYMPCTHTHEPDCAVRAAVESGEIDVERYESYLLIFESLVNQENL